MPEKPTIPVGDIMRQSRLPGWLKRIFGWFRGLVVHAGPVDIQLAEKPRITPPPTWGPHR